MKTLLKTSLLAFALAMALAACGNTPISVPLDDFSIDIGTVTDTANKVIYSKQPASFAKAYVAKTINITGKLTYTAVAGSNTLNITFYASASDPKNHTGCNAIGEIYICDPSGEKAISKPSSFTKDQAAPITLGDPNSEVLAEGINNGQIWIGALVTESLSINTKFSFSNMVAHVTIF